MLRRLNGARQSDEDAGQSYSLHYVVTDPGFQQNAVILTAEKSKNSKTIFSYSCQLLCEPILRL